MRFTQEQVEALGFLKVETYRHGDDNEFETTTYEKGSIEIDFDTENGVPAPSSPEVTVGLCCTQNATFEDLKVLDRLFNRCASQQ